MRRSFVPLLVLALLAATVIACSSSGLSPPATPESTGPAATEAPTLPPGDRLTTVEIVRKLRPAVVQVLTEDATQGTFGQVSPSRGVGTGVIIDADGLIATNNHVIRVGGNPTGRIASSITITLFDGRTASARVVGSDPPTDLAVLRIDVAGLTAAELGSAVSVPVGADVVAIGFALDLAGDPTVTRGVVSAKRTIQQPNINVAMPDAIQTDAGINPGNSGGPLVDDRGRVIGINTSIIAGAQNIGFAISVDLVKPITAELIQNGEVTRGFLGVGFEDVQPSQAAALGLPKAEGVAIISVVLDSPAAAAGFQPDDVIIGLAEIEIGNSGDLLEALRVHKTGERVIVRYYRAGDEQQVELTLSERSN